MTWIMLVALAVAAATPSFAFVPGQDGPLHAQQFRHPDLYYGNTFRPVAELPVEVSRGLAPDLNGLGVDPEHAFFDLRTGRWGTLIVVEPLIPGSGVGNTLQWRDLGLEARPHGEALEQAVWDAFRSYLTAHAAELRIDPQELAEPTVTVIGDRLIYIHVGRTIDGIPVRDAFVKAALNSGNLVLWGERNWGPVEVSTAPQLSAAEADNVVRGHVEGFPITGLRDEAHLELIPTSSQPEEAATFPGAGLEYRLAWVLRPEFSHDLGSWEALVDANSGELLSFVDTNHYASRRVEGGIFPVSNDGVGEDGTLQFGFPMPFADVTLDGVDVGFTTAGGNAPTGSDSGTLATALEGPFMRMNDNCGTVDESTAAGDLDLEGVPLPGTDCEVPAGHSSGDTNASRTGFYELNRLAEQARGYIPDNTWVSSQLTANMNINLNCNAFWSPGAGTVNFYTSGGGCANTGEIAAIFDHEWGHGMDNNDSLPFVSNPGEGIADLFAQNRLNESCIGRNFRPGEQCGGYGDPCLDCTGVRDTDWANRASGQPHDIAWADANCGFGPAPCGGGVHCEGVLDSESGWDLVHRDLMGFEGSPFNLDLNTALEIGTRLAFHGTSNVGNSFQCTTDGTGGCNADSTYLGFLTADDDDGDLTNGTPHMTAIFAAFDRHQVACNVPAPVDSGCAGGPTTAPTNLSAETFDEGMELSWDPVSGAEEYWIFRTEGVNGCDFGKALVGTTTDTTFTETGLRNGFEVLYSVVAVGSSDACTSPMSACHSVFPTAGPSGFIEGTVIDADTGLPIAGAAVEAVGPVTIGDETDADGFYSIVAPVGTYDVTVDHVNYDPETVPGVVVTEGGTEVVDFELTLTAVPIADISPDSFTFDVTQGNTDSATLNVGNIGMLDLEWSIAEDEVPALQSEPVLLEEWEDNFDSYDAGSQIHGQGGWKGWSNDPAAGALVSDAQAQSAPNSVEIVGASDLVHEYTDSDSGQWVYTAWQFIPTDFTGATYFILLNSYDDSGSGLNWSTQVQFVGGTNTVVNDGASGGTLPLIRDQWVEIRVEIDLDADTQDFYYNGDLLYSGTWTNENSGGGAAVIDAVDLFANGASAIYYDDLSLVDVTVPPACVDPNEVPWLSVDPNSGITPPDDSIPVEVAVDTTDLDLGEHTAHLCVTTNDPAAELVEIPVNLTVGEPLPVVLELDPTELDFGDVPVGETSPPQASTLSNVGSADATGLGFDLSGSADFEVDVSDCGDTLPAGGSCEISVTFTPAGPGPADATLDLSSNEGATAELSLAGNGVGGQPVPSETLLVSRANGADGDKGNDRSFFASVSTDGRYVAFDSDATNLHPDGTGDVRHVYARDLQTHETILVSRASGADGETANAISYRSAISADGRYVTFDSQASNLHPDDTDDLRDVFVRDLQTHETILVSRGDGADGPTGSANSFAPTISADGRYVAFYSFATNLHPDDTDLILDIFVRDLQNDETILASRASGADGTKGNLDSRFPRISADGRYVAFESRANSIHPDKVDGIPDVFVRDLQEHVTVLVSRGAGPDGEKGNGFSERATISADGRYVAFYSHATNLHPEDTDSTSDVLVRDLQEHALILVSRASGADGEKSNNASLDPAIAADGGSVAFYSRASNIHPDKLDSIYDVFVRDLQGEQTILASRASGADGEKGNGDSIEPTISANGRRVAFYSRATTLHPDDPDDGYDVFVRDLPGSPPGPVELVLDPSSLDFGDVPVGETSPPQASTLLNVGSADATGLGFDLSGSADFEVDVSDCGDTLPAGQSCAVSVTLTPTQAGPATATLSVSSDQGASASLALSGVGVGPSEITLAAEGYRVRGIHTVDLFWQGASSDEIDIWRDGALIVTVPNDGEHTDSTGRRGRATYIYQVCEAGTSVCSNEVTVRFGGGG